MPAPLRKALGLEPGDVLVAKAEEGRLVLESKEAILERWRRRFAAARPEGVSMVDELIADRREEFRREEAKLARDAAARRR